MSVWSWIKGIFGADASKAAGEIVDKGAAKAKKAADKKLQPKGGKK